MNNDPVYQRLREIGWRRRLSPSEEAELRTWLAAHPNATADQELESSLNELLNRLPDAPVPSNFTTRVLQAIERDAQPKPTLVRDWTWFWRILVPRAALTMLVAGAGAFAFQQHRERTQTGESIVTVLGVPTLPGPDVLENFDVIRRLDAAPVADQELLALLE